MVESTGMRVGRRSLKAYPTTKLEKKPKQSYSKGRLNKKVAMTRAVIRDVVGLMPYEKRILDIMKTGGAAAEKRVYKFGKKRLGTHRRSLLKREELKRYEQAQRAASKN